MAKFASNSQRRLSSGIIAIYIATKEILAVLISNKTERVSFNSGCVIRVAKRLEGDWLIVLH